MNPPNEISQGADLRDYLAAERTFLAWVRTGLALMGFGFVVARFGLFLQQLDVFQRTQQISSTGFSLWFGTALIAGGVIVNLASVQRHVRLVRQLDEGKLASAGSLTQTLAPAFFLAIVGIVGDLPGLCARVGKHSCWVKSWEHRGECDGSNNRNHQRNCR